MRILIWIALVVLGACSTAPKLPFEKINLNEVTPEEVVLKGTDDDVFSKAKMLLEQKNYPGFATLVKEVVNINMQNKVGDTLLHLASGQQSVGAVKTVLARKPSLNIQNNFDYTPLMYAEMSNSEDIVLTLLKAGSNPDITDGWDMTCLMRSAYHDDLSMVKLFMQFKGSPFSPNPKVKKASELATWTEVKSALIPYEKQYLKSFPTPEPKIGP